MMLTERSPCFIISTGRSGSKMLALVLACHPEVLALHEPRPYLSTESFLAWRGSIPVERLKREIREKRDWILNAARYNGLLYAESSHFLAHVILPLYELYQPRLIYLSRDVRDFVRSGSTRRWYTRVDPKTYLARILRRRTLMPFGNPIEDHQLVPPREAKTRFEKTAWLWNEVNANIQAQLEQLPQASVFQLRLEEFDAEVLRELLDFLELMTPAQLLGEMMAVAQTRPNRSERPCSIRPKQEWTDEQMTNLMRFAGEQMRRLGYWAEGSR